MLADYRGPSNSEGIFEALVGDTIAAVFVAESEYGWERWFVVSSGEALVTNLKTGAYWVVKRTEVARKLARERSRLQDAVRRLSRLGTIDLAPPIEEGEE